MAQKNISQVVSALNAILAADGDLLVEVETEIEDSQGIKRSQKTPLNAAFVSQTEGQPKRAKLSTNDGAE